MDQAKEHPSPGHPDFGERIISSAQNPRIKQIVKLRQRAHREDEGLIIVEGRVELKRALDNAIRPTTLFFSPELIRGQEDLTLIRRCTELGAEMFRCGESVFRKIAYGERDDGILIVARRPNRTLADLPPAREPLFLVADSIEKPGNLGAILRSADAAGADAVIVCDRCTDIYNPNSVRASLGTVFSVPVIEASSEETLQWLRRNKIQILAATPSAQTSYTDADLRPGTAILVGGEHAGLSDFWMSKADIRLRIPMRGQADSLNVAASATILLFEAARQRTS